MILILLNLTYRSSAAALTEKNKETKSDKKNKQPPENEQKFDSLIYKVTFIININILINIFPVCVCKVNRKLRVFF